MVACFAGVGGGAGGGGRAEDSSPEPPRCHNRTLAPASRPFPVSCSNAAISSASSREPCCFRMRNTSRLCLWSRSLIDSNSGNSRSPSRFAATARSLFSTRGLIAPKNCRVRYRGRSNKDVSLYPGEYPCEHFDYRLHDLEEKERSGEEG